MKKLCLIGISLVLLIFSGCSKVKVSQDAGRSTFMVEMVETAEILRKC